MTNSPAVLIPRLATPDDVPAIRALVVRSARGLSIGFYTPEQIEAAIVHVFGVDSQLISDSTYYVIDSPDGLAAAGGWSKRRTLFGGDQMKHAEDPLLDPARRTGLHATRLSNCRAGRVGTAAQCPRRLHADDPGHWFDW